jgi:hypothetical protein
MVDLSLRLDLTKISQQKRYNKNMDSAKQQLVEKLKTSNNVLVTVSRDPSVDQLAALLGLSLLLNKQGKHSAAVFSGKIPSTLEFLKPEDTIEKNTDSLRDFIIALDKSKADKLRYKVEDNIVRIFITPYKTSISQADLDFSQGDFNVDLVVALGVKDQADLDEAITGHGRILHDAVVANISISKNADGELGTINWRDPGASSLSELVTDLSQSLGDNLLDEQVATSLLTGIVAETKRFSNDKTTSQTMTNSAILMAAGANQQLVATKLEQPEPVLENHDDKSVTGATYETDQSDKSEEQSQAKSSGTDGVLEIEHNPQEEAALAEAEAEAEAEASQASKEADNTQNQNDSDDNTSSTPLEIELPAPEMQAPLPDATDQQPTAGTQQTSTLMTEPPTMGGTLTSSYVQDDLDPSTDPLSAQISQDGPLLEHNKSVNETAQPLDSSEDPAANTYTELATQPAFEYNSPTEPILDPLENNVQATQPDPAPSPALDSTPQPPAGPPTEPAVAPPSQLHIDKNGTITQLEEAVHSPHLQNLTVANADSARAEVDRALSSSTLSSQPPVEALNAQPLGPVLHPGDPLLVEPPTGDLSNSNLGAMETSESQVINPGNLGMPSPPPVPPPFSPI